MIASTNNGQDRMLICGDVEGKYEALLIRLEQILSKVGKFEQLFVVGEFFGPSHEENKKILNGDYIVPIPIYILGPINTDRTRYYTASAGENLGHNIIYLGRKGLFSTASGMKIAYLSGKFGEYQDECHYSSDTVKELIAQVTTAPDFSGVDILLTSQWPAGLEKYTTHTPDVAREEQLQVSPLISKLAAAVKPRYHFAGVANCHYERPPYRNHRVLQEAALHTTRFVGLARCGNPSRCKWIYAFNLCPMKLLDRTRLVEQPHNATEFPYYEILQELEAKEHRKKAALLESQMQKNQQHQYFYDVTAAGQDDVTGEKSSADQWKARSRKRKQDQQNLIGPKKPPQPCWFCLASPEVEKHLVASIGDFTYCAMAKGPLVEDHVLLMPITHVQSLTACQEDVREEFDKYKQALDRYFEDTDRIGVYFERNYRTQHMQLQCVPVPRDRAGQVLDAFKEKFVAHEIDFVEIREQTDIAELVNPGQPYFYAELPYGQKLYTKMMREFPLNFGRDVLACEQLLNCPEKVEWRECALSKEEETDSALKFRHAFSKYDFNMT